MRLCHILLCQYLFKRGWWLSFKFDSSSKRVYSTTDQVYDRMIWIIGTNEVMSITLWRRRICFQEGSFKSFSTQNDKETILKESRSKLTMGRIYRGDDASKNMILMPFYSDSFGSKHCHFLKHYTLIGLGIPNES